MKHHDYMPEIDGPQSRIEQGGRRILCKGGGFGSIVGAVVGGLIGGPAGALSGFTSGLSYDQGKAQQKSAAKAAEQAQANADKQASQADQAFNAANQKRPDTSAILSAAQQSGKSGPSGTMVTGPQGIDPSSLTLGKTTLLGS